MRKATQFIIAILCCAAAWSVQAADCRGGSLRGSTGKSGAPDQNVQCEMMGRIFCSLEQSRNTDLPIEFAVNNTADWLSHYSMTGSNRTGGDYKPAARAAAAYIYAHEKMPDWTAYNYAVWTCGLNQRITDRSAQTKVGPLWEQAAQACEMQFPGEGDGYGNDKLKQCLQSAMEKLVAEHAPKVVKR